MIPERAPAGASVLLCLLALWLWASPLTRLWMNTTPPWWCAWLLWLLPIALGAWLARRLARQDPDDESAP